MSDVAVHVFMLAYNVEPYLAQAIEGVLAQQTDFPVQLFIGEDCSTDSTPAIARAYADKYPERIAFLPSERNLGITANTARMLPYCTAKYLAVCDGDDAWIDPLKLQKQVDFLEAHPEYGVSYSDVKVISESGVPLDAPDYSSLRENYAEGDIFTQLLLGNFINNSTAVVRRDLLRDFHIDPERSYSICDYFMWLHVAARAKVHFLPEQTTAYRWHMTNVTQSAEKARNNQKKYQSILGDVLLDFARQNRRPLSPSQKTILFRKTLSALYRAPRARLWQRLHLLPLLFRYLPI